MIEIDTSPEAISRRTDTLLGYLKDKSREDPLLLGVLLMTGGLPNREAMLIERGLFDMQRIAQRIDELRSIK
jgi:hypothetical protein